MQSEELQSMTVIQLRKLAKENHIKLGAGIDKAGIVARIAEALQGKQPDSAAEANPQPEIPPVMQQPTIREAADAETDRQQTLADTDSGMADVTSVSPASGYRAWNDHQDQQGGYRNSYRAGWQGRVPAVREPAQKPAWQRSATPANRFGPQNRPQPMQSQQSIQPGIPQQPMQPQQSVRRAPAMETPERAPAARPTPANGMSTPDGYRLGYRASPQRQPYQGRNNEYNGYQNRSYQPNAYGGYQNRNYQQPQQPPQSNGYQQSGYRGNFGYRGSSYGYQQRDGVSEPFYNDTTLYRPGRDAHFAEQMEAGQLPDLLQKVETEDVSGILEVLPDGYGFLRGKTLLPGKKDIYVSVAQIHRYGLLAGDKVEGKARLQKDSDKFAALLLVERVNGEEAHENPNRQSFDELAAVYPNRRIVLESQSPESMTARLVDLIAPIGFGQRAMIVAPPDSGRLQMLCEISRAIHRNDPDAEVMMLLIDVAPEEATEITESVEAEVYASTFADAPDTQTRVSELMLERAQRLVEQGRNVVILLDSLTKLTRAYQSALSQGSRPMTNTVTPSALVKPKSFFGAARNTRDAGSLTVIATIAVETGSRVDEIIYEEFRGKANSELFLCTAQRGDPVYPMINLQQSGTKKEDMLLSEQQKEGLRSIRKVLSSATNGEAVVQLIDMMKKTKCNQDLLNRLKEWIALWEKSGYLKR